VRVADAVPPDYHTRNLFPQETLSRQGSIDPVQTSFGVLFQQNRFIENGSMTNVVEGVHVCSLTTQAAKFLLPWGWGPADGTTGAQATR